MIDRPKPPEQRLGALDRALRRRGEPVEGARIDPRAVHHQHRLGEIDARDLRRVVLRARVEIALVVEAERTPGAYATGATCALRRRCARDLPDLERGSAGPGIVRGDAREAAVDHRDHALDRDRGLGDVGREDHLATIGAGDRRVLLRRGEIAVQLRDLEIGVARDRGAGLGGLADLGRAGEEHQHVTVEPLLDQIAHRARDLQRQGAIIGPRQVLDRDREGSSLAGDDRRVEEGSDRCGVERRRHHHHREIGRALARNRRSSPRQRSVWR